MQKMVVEIEAKGFTGLTAENIKKALDHYFGSPALNVSFTVSAQQSAQATKDELCDICGRPEYNHSPKGHLYRPAVDANASH